MGDVLARHERARGQSAERDRDIGREGGRKDEGVSIASVPRIVKGKGRTTDGVLSSERMPR